MERNCISIQLAMNNLAMMLRKQPRSKRIKYLVTNLISEVQNLYSENYKALFKETKEGLNKWRDIPCLWDTIVKIIIFLKLIYTINAIPIRTLASSFAESTSQS